MATTIALKAQIQWRATFSDASSRWIGICDPMNLALEADSLDELYSVIDETMHIVLLDLLLDDELDRYLQERGWQVRGAPVVAKTEDITFDVPWELIAEGARDPERRAH